MSRNGIEQATTKGFPRSHAHHLIRRRSEAMAGQAPTLSPLRGGEGDGSYGFKDSVKILLGLDLELF